ncbi:MAG: hypothetical protein P0S94_01495 [Simkaniaceae bacterium]|nr:hypothetical protein [Simkaniaceae bacterium]
MNAVFLKQSIFQAELSDNIRDEMVQAFENDSTVLSLADMNVDSAACEAILSIALTFMPDIEEIDLSENEIEVVPSTIGEFKELYELNLSSNHLHVVSDKIGNLAQLKVLDLSNNDELESIPRSIRHLVLDQLDLEYTNVTTFPTEMIETLSKINFLNLAEGVELPEIVEEDQVVPQ